MVRFKQTYMLGDAVKVELAILTICACFQDAYALELLRAEWPAGSFRRALRAALACAPVLTDRCPARSCGLNNTDSGWAASNLIAAATGVFVSRRQQRRIRFSGLAPNAESDFLDSALCGARFSGLLC
jgi:hypothetical protein